MNADLIKRAITMVRLVPLKGYASTREIHNQLESAGYLQSERTTQRDLASMADEFGLESRPRDSAFPNELEWTRKKEI